MTRKATFRGRTQLDRSMVRSNIRFVVPWGNRILESETFDGAVCHNILDFSREFSPYSRAEI